MLELYANVNFEWLADFRKKVGEAVEIARQLESKIDETESLVKTNTNRAQANINR